MVGGCISLCCTMIFVYRPPIRSGVRAVGKCIPRWNGELVCNTFHDSDSLHTSNLTKLLSSATPTLDQRAVEFCADITLLTIHSFFYLQHHLVVVDAELYRYLLIESD